MIPNKSWQNKFTRIFIDSEVVESDIAQRFTAVFGDKVTIGHPDQMAKGELSASEFAESKKQIFLTEHKGSFFKRCPGFHKGLACCNYFVLNLGFQCDMDCSYCYLQSFINSNYLTVFTNGDKALRELEKFAPDFGNHPVRVGTGEVIDSLSLDPLTLYSKKLIEFFYDYPNWKLEFKTKSDYVDQFIDIPHRKNVIVSWSINPPNIIEQEEHGTASFTRRMNAAKKCLARNFLLAFHIDPMVWHPDWKENYSFLVDEITQQFSPQDIPYISLGALRFQPEQKNIMRERFGMKSLVTQAETFPSQDGKLRYDYELRQEMFQFVIQKFKQNNAKWKVFLCMETPESWMDTFGTSPHRTKELKPLFQPIMKPADHPLPS